MSEATIIGTDNFKAMFGRFKASMHIMSDEEAEAQRRKEWEESADRIYKKICENAGILKYGESVALGSMVGDRDYMLFANEFLSAFERLFNHQERGIFVSGRTGIGKTYTALWLVRTALRDLHFMREIKTEWMGEIRQYRAPVRITYATTGIICDALESARYSRGHFAKPEVMNDFATCDILILDEVGFLSSIGRKNAEIAALSQILRSKPTGIILITRLSGENTTNANNEGQTTFKSVFGDALWDVVAGFACPYTADCKSRRPHRKGRL